MLRVGPSSPRTRERPPPRPVRLLPIGATVVLRLALRQRPSDAVGDIALAELKPGRRPPPRLRLPSATVVLGRPSPTSVSGL